MNQFHREKIDNLCNNLTAETLDMSKLWPKLLLNRVFNEDDVNVSKWVKKLNDLQTIRNICQTIKTRGPNAFDNFLKSLKESGHHTLVDILCNRKPAVPRITPPTNVVYNSSAESDIESSDEDDSSTADNYHKSVNLYDGPLEIKVKQATKFRDGPEYKNIEMYPMRSKPRGIVLIITNLEYKLTEFNRPSAICDEVKLNKLFTEMGFEVKSHFNKTGAEIKEIVEAFSKLQKLRQVDSAFIIISAHGSGELGNQKTKIHGVDYKVPGSTDVSCTEIVDYFTSSKCVHLRGKPKIFIFQTCRGKLRQRSFGKSQTDGLPIEKTDVPPIDAINNEFNPIEEEPICRNFEDIIIAYGTISGHESFRDSSNGSWFIQILCEVFMNYAHKKHLVDLFTLTDRRMKDLRLGIYCQTMVTVLKGFNKHCYLNPGLF